MILRLVFQPCNQTGLFESAFIIAERPPALVIDDLDRLLGVLGNQQVLFQDLQLLRLAELGFIDLFLLVVSEVHVIMIAVAKACLRGLELCPRLGCRRIQGACRLFIIDGAIVAFLESHCVAIISQRRLFEDLWRGFDALLARVSSEPSRVHLVITVLFLRSIGRTIGKVSMYITIFCTNWVSRLTDSNALSYRDTWWPSSEARLTLLRTGRKRRRDRGEEATESKSD